MLPKVLLLTGCIILGPNKGDYVDLNVIPANSRNVFDISSWAHHYAVLANMSSRKPLKMMVMIVNPDIPKRKASSGTKILPIIQENVDMEPLLTKDEHMSEDLPTSR
jgi:hypothetical protein